MGHRAYMKPEALPEYFAKLANFDGSLQTKLALKFVLLTFVRTGELRGARWPELNLGKAEWRIPAERMKMKESISCLYQNRRVATLRELQALTGGARIRLSESGPDLAA